jgi:hypothetical protein
VLVTPNGKTAYITVRNDNSVRVPGAIGVVDNRSGAILDTWPYPGGPWPHGVFYEPQVLR